MKTSIIGTAGRKDDAARLTKEMYRGMYNLLLEKGFHPHLVSGGAAWADHLAVSLFLAGKCEKLTLHLPAPWRGNGYAGTQDGGTANYYHKKFSEKMGGDTLFGIERARIRGAKLIIHEGFKTRNLEVAKSEQLYAFTFGEFSSYGEKGSKHSSAKDSGLKDGGTAHTWDNKKSLVFEHIMLPL